MSDPASLSPREPTMTPIAAATERSKHLRAVLNEVGILLERTAANSGLIWERYIFENQSLVLMSTPTGCDIFVSPGEAETALRAFLG